MITDIIISVTKICYIKMKSKNNHIFVKCNQSLPEEIIKHEMKHIRQRHTPDILFIELLLTFCRFNPIFLIYRKADPT